MFFQNKDRTNKKLLDPDLAFCALIMLLTPKNALYKLYYDGVYNPTTEEPFTEIYFMNTIKESKFYKIFEAKRIKELGGTLEEDSYPTTEEFEFASKYYNDHIVEEAKRIRYEWERIKRNEK